MRLIEMRAKFKDDLFLSNIYTYRVLVSNFMLLLKSFKMCSSKALRDLQSNKYLLTLFSNYINELVSNYISFTLVSNYIKSENIYQVPYS